MKDFSIDDFAAIVGIDWPDNKHDICELPAGTRNYPWSVISSKPDQLQAWGMAEILTKVVFKNLIERRPDRLLSPRFHLWT